MLGTHCLSVTGCQSCSWAGFDAGLEELPEEEDDPPEEDEPLEELPPEDALDPEEEPALDPEPPEGCLEPDVAPLEGLACSPPLAEA